MLVGKIKFVDREDECRLVCHPHLPDLRGRKKAPCVVVAKQPGAGKTSLGQECLKVARSKPPQGRDPEEWKAELPVLTLYCEAKQGDTLPDVLASITHHANEKLQEIQAGDRELEIGSCEEVETKVKSARMFRATESIVAPRIVLNIFAKLKLRAHTLELSDKTTRLLTRLKHELLDQPLIEWDRVVFEIVKDRTEAEKVYQWLGEEAARQREEAARQREEAARQREEEALEKACLDLRRACEKWQEQFDVSVVGDKSVRRPVALLIVVDEAQLVLPGENMDEWFSDLRQKRREIQEAETGRSIEKTERRDLTNELLDIETKIKHARRSIKGVLEKLQGVFKVCRFLWTGISSTAVELQMSKGDNSTGFRVISMALPPLDLTQWNEALGSRSDQGSPMEWMLRRQQELSGKPNETIDSVEGLQEMMRCTGGWPIEVRRYVGKPDREQRAWVKEVFGNGHDDSDDDRGRMKRIKAMTLNLLDRVYVEQEKSVFQHLQAIGFLRKEEMGRTFYELHHLSGLQLVDGNGAPAIYVPDIDYETSHKVVGVTVTSDLRTAKLRHTTGSLWLQARLSEDPEIGIFKEGWESYTLNEAEGATINMLRFLKELGVPQQLGLDEPRQLELGEVFPWLREASPAIAGLKLQTDELCVVRGLKIVPEGGHAKLQPENVPGALENHGKITSQIQADDFLTWFGKWCTDWREKWDNGDRKTYIYVFGEKSASGDILLILGGIHIHIQVKNAKKSSIRFKKEVEKMKKVSWGEVLNVFVLINYYGDKSRPYDEMSRQRTAWIEAAVQEPRSTETDLPKISELCLVVALQGLWQRRLEKDINKIGLNWYLENFTDPESEAVIPEKQPPTKIRRALDTGREECDSDAPIEQKQPAADITS